MLAPPTHFCLGDKRRGSCNSAFCVHFVSVHVCVHLVNPSLSESLPLLRTIEISNALIPQVDGLYLLPRPQKLPDLGLLNLRILPLGSGKRRGGALPSGTSMLNF